MGQQMHCGAENIVGVRTVRRCMDPPSLVFLGSLFLVMGKHAELGIDAATDQQRGENALPFGLRIDIGKDAESQHIRLVGFEQIQHETLLHVPDLHIAARISSRHSTSQLFRVTTKRDPETAQTTPLSSHSSTDSPPGSLSSTRPRYRRRFGSIPCRRRCCYRHSTRHSSPHEPCT